MDLSTRKWTRRALLSCLLLAGVSGLGTSEAQVPIISGVDTSAEAVEAIQVPTVVFPETFVGPTNEAILRELLSRGPMDKGSSFTDGGFGLPSAAPTPLEKAKLDMARAAIEASRLAGTLNQPSTGEDVTLPTPAEQAAAKLERLREMQPAVLSPDPAAGVGVDTPPVQIAGPAGLSPIEQAKLRGEEPAPAVPAVAPAAPASGRPEVDLNKDIKTVEGSH